MPTIYFTGKVLPIKVTIDNLPPVIWESIADGSRTSILVTIIESEVSVEVVLDVYDERHLSELRNSALVYVRAAVDSFSFLAGWGLTVYLDRFIDPDGIETIVIPVRKGVGDVHSGYDEHTLHTAGLELKELFELVSKVPARALALNDLAVGISSSHQVAIGCARSVEGIRNLMTPLGTERGVAWGIMQDTLNIAKSYRSFITDLSALPRHGDSSYIEPDQLEKSIYQSHEIMRRYIEHVKRGGDGPLSDFEFLE